MPLQSKIILFFFFFLSLIVFQWLFFMSHEEKILKEEMSARASVLVKTLGELSWEPLLNFQISRLEMQIDSLKQEKDVLYARVVNSNFLVLADTRRDQEGWIYSGIISMVPEIIMQNRVLVAREPIIILESIHGMAEISFSLDSMLEKVKRSRILFIAIFISELILGFAFAVFLEIQVIRPLHKIAAGVDQISADSLKSSLTSPGKPSVEILKVSRAIDNMRNKLRKNQDELISKTRLATMGKIGFNLAHEIRNPLEAISGSVEILSSGIEENSKEFSYLGIIKEEIHNLNDYLTEFLDFTKAETGHRLDINPSELIGDSLLLLGPLLKKHRIDVSDNTASIENYWNVNPNQMKRVILNVLINSIEAIGSDGKIEIYTSLHDDKLELIISDSGCGLCVDNIDGVFDPYYSTKKDGSGIGLVLSRKIVEQHGGSISMTSNNSKIKYMGTSVKIKLSITGA
jgi:signal transduction histidine kinase